MHHLLASFPIVGQVDYFRFFHYVINSVVIYTLVHIFQVLFYFWI